ncbi:MAG: histidine phosphatase family protein [Miltoncostaeaceae bacterium]
MRRAFTLVRHGITNYNVEGVLNSDPSVPVHLTDEGQEQARRTQELLAHQVFDLAVHSRLPRTEETLRIILDGQEPPIEVYPEFDDQSMGDFEGRHVSAFREFRAKYGIEAAPPGGESRLDALARFTKGYQRLLDCEAVNVLVVIHDVTIRFVANASRGDDPIRGPIRHVPNASITRLSEPELRRAIDVMDDRLAGSP